MVQEKIDKILPYINREFITYELAEEGIYVPTLNFWVHTTDEIVLDLFLGGLESDLNKKGYELSVDKYDGADITPYHITPIIAYDNDGGYKIVNKGWSIENILDIVYCHISNV